MEAQRDHHEKLKVKPGLCWQHQNVGDSRVVGYLLKKAGNREWNKPKREKFVSTNNNERNWRSEDCFDIDIEMQCLRFLCWFSITVFSQYAFFPFCLEWECILFHCMLEVCDFDFYGVYI